MIAIAAIDNNWGIGLNGELLERIPEDMKLFKLITFNSVVVMGKKTFESLPNQKPLENRINIVLSKDENFNDERVIVCRSVNETLEKIKEYNKDIYIIGGEAIYNEFLPYCSGAFITKINKSYKADKYFPNLDNNNNWELTYEGDLRKYKNINFKITGYNRIK